MEKQQTNSNASTQSGLMEWRVCEDERDWDLLCEPEVEKTVANAVPLSWNRRKLLRPALAAALLFLALGIPSIWWLWRQAELGKAKTQNELRAAADTDLWASVHLPATQTNANETNYLSGLLSQSQRKGQEQVTSVEIRHQVDNWAVVRVLLRLQSNGPTYRQTRLYRNSDRGWQRAAAIAALWGQPREVDSQHFIFEYHSLDQDAIVAASPRIEQSYLALYHTLFGGEPEAEKLVIIIDPEKPIKARIPEAQPPASITVGSPAVLLAPSELSEGEILAQAVVLELAFRLTQKASDDYAVPMQWHSLRDGLRLWLLWHQELPLATWKEPVVRWVFDQEPSEQSLEGASKVTFAYNLCANHALWMVSPLEIGIWLACFPQSTLPTQGSGTSIVSERLPPQHTVQIPAPLPSPISRYDRATALQSSPTDVVVLATVVDYIVAKYGSDRLPALLAALRQYPNWETLTPALFGVSQEEFSRGWHEFLNREYGIPQ